MHSHLHAQTLCLKDYREEANTVIDFKDGVDIIDTDVVRVICIFLIFIAAEESPAAVIGIVRLFTIHESDFSPALYEHFCGKNKTEIIHQMFLLVNCDLSNEFDWQP